MNEQIKNKTVRGVRIIWGIVLGLIVFAISFKIIIFIVAIVGSLGLSAFGIHISESERAYRDLEAVANILGFIGAAYLANKVYKRVTRKNIDSNAPPKKWYQFKGFM